MSSKRKSSYSENLRNPHPKRAKHTSTFKGKACDYIMKSKYGSLLNCLYKSSASFRNAFVKKMGKVIRRNIFFASTNVPFFKKECSVENIAAYNNEDFIESFKGNAPVAYEVFISLLTTAHTRTSAFCDSKRNKVTVLVAIIAMVLYSRRRSNNFLQAFLSMNLWKNGASNDILSGLQKMCLTLGPKGTRGAIDRLCKAFKDMPLQLKESIEAEYVLPFTNVVKYTDEISTECDTWSVQSASEEDKSQTSCSDLDRSETLDDSCDRNSECGSLNSTLPYSTAEPTEKEPHSTLCRDFAVCWDNIQIQSTARHQGLTSTNKFMLWALAFAVENRMNFHSSGNDHSEIHRAQEMEISTFLPTAEEYNIHREVMVKVVASILKANFPWMKKSQIPMNQHKYHHKSKQRSNVMNLGIINENPASTAGCIQIMQELHKYVPRCGNDKLYTILCHGDGLTCERSTDAQRARAPSKTPLERLEGLLPCPGEFHKRMLRLQDTYNMLFSSSSATERGTLYHIKQNFNHKNAKKNIYSDFNHCNDLISFSTEGYCCLLAMKLMGTTGLTEVPKSYKGRAVTNFARKISEQIVHKVWLPFDVCEVLDASEEDAEKADVTEKVYNFCICETDTGEDMICCSNGSCNRGRWFHYSCVGQNEETVPEGDWWCSEECKSYSIYCICKRNLPGHGMVTCCNADCLVKKFHLNCVGLSTIDHTDDWLCSPDCTKKASDDLYEYVKALIWRGLGHMVRRQSIRENDGPSMLLHWKIDMLDFWSMNHFKYLIIGHRLLAGANGCVQERLKNNLIWNRTVNLSGGPEANLEVDLVNEFLNRDFLAMLKKGRGHYSEEHIARAGHMVGDIATKLTTAFTTLTQSTTQLQTNTSDRFYRKDIEKFVSEYAQDEVFCYMPGRRLDAFTHFKFRLTKVKNPGKLKSRLRKYSKNMDDFRDAVI